MNTVEEYKNTLKKAWKLQTKSLYKTEEYQYYCDHLLFLWDYLTDDEVLEVQEYSHQLWVNSKYCKGAA